jgi:ornithine cyclodeaminase/alanine dehydrogenase-like protein (mu-crystallin family)
MIVLSADDVEALLPLGEAISVMEDALTSLSRGQSVMPLRAGFWPAEAGNRGLTWMPAFRVSPSPAFGAKLLCLVPDNPTRGMDSHQGAVLVFNGTNGEVSAVLSASAITAIRTAAVSALATRALSRTDASQLTIIGAGVQGKWHALAIPVVREIERIRLVSRDGRTAAHLASELRKQLSCRIEVVESVQDALRGATVVVTATNSSTPVLDGTWLEPGCHVNAVGASSTSRQEIDTATVARARVFTDRLESLRAEAADYVAAIDQNLISLDGVPVELGEVLLGRAKGRQSQTEITLFRSLGLAVEDLFAALFVVERAKTSGRGTSVG